MTILFDSVGFVNVTAFPTGVAGLCVYRSDLFSFFVYNGTDWVSFTPATAAGESNTITMASGEQVLAEGGTTPPADSQPSYAFTGDENTGLWNPSSGVVRIASDGTGVAEFDDTEGLTLLVGAFQAPDGAEGAPSYTNEGDEDTGMWFPADNTLAFSTDGNEAFRIGSNGVLTVATADYETLLTGDDDIPNKAYVDSLSAGLDPKESCRVATTADLDTETGDGVWFSTGSGVGKTLTAGVVGTTTIDTIVLADGDRVLVKNESAGLGASHNGIYVASATAVGSATILTRATDQDGSPASEVSGGNFTFIEAGSQSGSLWAVVWDGNVSVDSDAMNWVQIGGGLAGFPLLAPVSATPQYSFSGDTDTGVTSPSADQLDLKAGGNTGLEIVTAGPRLAANLDLNNFDIVSKPAAGLTSDGGQLDIIAADGGATSGAGGDIFITAGKGYGSEGGDITITAGAGDTGINAGDLNLSGGTPTGGGATASLALNGGFAAGIGGSLALQAGNGLTGFNGGAVAITGGSSAGGVGSAGLFELTSGAAGGSGAGADIALRPGGSASGTSGHVTIRRASATGDTPQIRMHELFANGSDYIGLRAPADVGGAGGSVIYTLPTAGVEGQHLKLGASGVMEWDSGMAELLVTTSNDTETELVGPGTTYYDIASGTTHAVEILVVAEKSDGSEAAMWRVLVGIKNVSGTTSLVGSDVTTTISNTPGWSIAVSADNTNDRLAVKVTGVAATTINWKAKVTGVQV